MAISYRKSDIPDHLQKYFQPAEIGLEQSPQEYVAEMVQVFREVRRVLADDGTLWLNLGDSYATGGMSNPSSKSTLGGGKDRGAGNYNISRSVPAGLKEKDLIGIPWRVAFALQADGWYLRQDIIWSKPNPMPESVKDRCTKSHEYLFLLTKSPRYYYDAEAIAEPTQSGIVRDRQRPNGVGTDTEKQGNYGFTSCGIGLTRNRRSVWTIATQPYKEAHFAVFPQGLVEPCILAGSRECDTVFDPFTGSGTALEVAQRLGRKALGIELNPAYLPLIRKRLAQQPIAWEVPA